MCIECVTGSCKSLRCCQLVVTQLLHGAEIHNFMWFLAAAREYYNMFSAAHWSVTCTIAVNNHVVTAFVRLSTVPTTLRNPGDQGVSARIAPVLCQNNCSCTVNI